MTTCTPIYGLEYAIGSDRPCDIGDTLCAFANQVDALITGFQETLYRIETIPMARVSREPMMAADSTSDGFVFDSVDIDTDRMVDLVLRPTVMTVNRTGLFLTTARATSTTTAYPATYILTENVGILPAIQQDSYFLAAGIIPDTGPDGTLTSLWVPLTATHPNPYWSPGDTVSLNDNFSAGTVTTNSATHTIYWFSDV